MRRVAVVVTWLFTGCPSLHQTPGDLATGETHWTDVSGETGDDPGDDDRRDASGLDARDRRDGSGPGDGTWDPGCAPQCWNRVCGPDGCGGVCGVCPAGTACSYDRSMCVSQSVQKALGGPCGPTDGCLPMVSYPGGTYPNPRWPGCLHDQCLEGPCVAGFCSRPCRMMQDVVVNGTGLMAPDGIEDPDTPTTDCAGGRTDLFDGGFACVLVEPGATEGLCYPTASFLPCEGDGDCLGAGRSGVMGGPEGCGFLVVLGNLERRCLAAPAGAAGIAQPCGYDALAGEATRCEAWACTADGCTQACASDEDCATSGASCDPTSGLCSGTGGRCEDDGDCSAWGCRPDVVLDDLGWPAGAGGWGHPMMVVQACGPRECRRDADCGDPDFYCLHEAQGGGPGQVSATGRCARRQVGGRSLGEPCDDDPGDGLPDVVCRDRAYCLDGRCGAMCVGDDDCGGAGGRSGRDGQPMACGLREFDSKGASSWDVPVPVPVCLWGGESWAECQVREDCETGTCAPWIPVGTGAVELRCLEPPIGSVGPGNPCGAAAWGQTCDTRVCLGETDVVAGVCSTVCRDAKDCPGPIPFGTGYAKFLCEAVRFHRAGTVYLADDAYVSWCLPVPGESSLAPCEPIGSCAVAGETCRAVVRSGVPGGEDRVEYRCVRADTGGETGAGCDPGRGGEGCRSRVCAPTAIRGVGFCTSPCDSDATCQGLAGGAARCVERVVLPRESPLDPVTVRECRVVDTCVTCRDDRDCPDPIPGWPAGAGGLRCADLAVLPYEDDFRCAPSCEADADCVAWGDGVTCIEVDAPLETSKTGKVRVCAPLACP